MLQDKTSTYLVNDDADSSRIGVTLGWHDATKVGDTAEEIPRTYMLLCFSVYSNQTLQRINFKPQWTVIANFVVNMHTEKNLWR